MGMITEKSVVIQNLQTVNTTVPSVSAALTKGGAVSLVFAAVHARPKETSESPYEATKSKSMPLSLMIDWNYTN